MVDILNGETRVYLVLDEAEAAHTNPRFISTFPLMTQLERPREPTSTGPIHLGTAALGVPQESTQSAIVAQFLHINARRIERVFGALASHQRSLVELLPLLFHVNHPLMPGYVDKQAPAGVHAYTPDEATLTAANRVTKSFSYEPSAASGPTAVDALYLMGSRGTIAQSAGSDFDVWLCHRPDLERDDVKKLAKKADAISTWAKTLQLEVHIFVMSAEQFRTSGAESLSTESSGSTQHHLLLDEFYRTGLLLAGKRPIWWLVHPDEEHDYERTVDALFQRNTEYRKDYLDFGSVADIEAAEFFGATLWQLSKAVSSPHKSLLKILLLEAYAREYPKTDLLSQRFKKAIYGKTTDPDRVDPYILLMEKVSEYLSRPVDRERLELARRCFYYKADPQLSHIDGQSRNGWQQREVQALVTQWGWNRALLSQLDARTDWKIERVLEERRALVTALMHSYRALSRFARKYATNTMVSERDMTVLGRKLFSSFEQKAGKIDLVNLHIARDLCERNLSLQYLEQSDGQGYWVLFKGSVNDRKNATALKRAWTLTELVAWCHFNGLTTANTRISLYAGNSGVNKRDIEAVREHFQQFFPRSLVETNSMEDYVATPHLVAASVIVNLGVDPMPAHSRNGGYLTTKRADALSYGGWRENLVHDTDYVIVTSWREVLTFRFRGMEGLMSCLCEHLRWISRTGEYDSNKLPINVCSPRYGEIIGRRLNTLFADLSAWYRHPSAAPRRRYVVRGGNNYYVLLSHKGGINLEFSGTFSELLEFFARPNPEFTEVTVDPGALDDSLLETVFSASSEAQVQLFYLIEGESIEVYVLDENGALFTEKMPFYTENALLNQYAAFFESVQFRQNSAPGAEGDGYGTFDVGPILGTQDLDHHLGAFGQETITFQRITRENFDGKYQLSPAEYAQTSSDSPFFDIQVIGQIVNDKTEFTLSCNRREFSTRDYSKNVFDEMARYIMSLRKSQESYPIHITDIDLSRLPGDGPEGTHRATVVYLQYKKRIEQRLNKALEDMVTKNRRSATA